MGKKIYDDVNWIFGKAIIIIAEDENILAIA
jgi:hypothetical protein